MINNKTRIISFLMAFLLIFTFAFINPLTVQKSDAFAFAIPTLTPAMTRIITGVLVSAGYIIHEGTTPSLDYDIALTDMSKVIYQTLDNAQKVLLGALSIADNIVEVPVSLYNSIVNNAKKVIIPDTITSLSSQNITTRYITLEPNNTSYPDLIVPIYYNDSSKSGTGMTDAGTFTTRKVDLRDAQPFFIYEGTGSSVNEWQLEGLKYFWNDFANNNLPVLSVDGLDNLIFLTPDLSPYKILQTGTSSDPYYIKYEFLGNYDNSNAFVWSSNNSTGGYSVSRFIDLLHSEVSNINNCIIYSYFLYRSSNSSIIKTITDIYNRETGEFQLQIIRDLSGYSVIHELTDKITTVPCSYDLDLVPSETITPPVTNTAGDNVITLPNTLSDTIGATSTDVNVEVETDIGAGDETVGGETTGLLQKILDALIALGDYILEGIKNIFMPDLDGIILLKEAIEEKFSIIGELKEMIDDILDILTNNEPEPPNIIIPLSKAEGNIDYGQDCIALDLSWYGRYKEVVDLFIIGFAYLFFIWRLYQRLPGIISGSDGINWSALSGKSEYSGSGNIGFKPGGGKK